MPSLMALFIVVGSRKICSKSSQRVGTNSRIRSILRKLKNSVKIKLKDFQRYQGIHKINKNIGNLC